MTAVTQVFAVVAAAFHVAAFVLESLVFRRPWAQRLMLGHTRVDPGVFLWAFNQGFYNLFLAIGALGGLIWGGDKGHAIALFACACMAGAGIVLLASDRRMLRAAATQAVPPILALVLAAIL